MREPGEISWGLSGFQGGEKRAASVPLMGFALCSARLGIISRPRRGRARQALHTGREPLLESSYSSPPSLS